MLKINTILTLLFLFNYFSYENIITILTFELIVVPLLIVLYYSH